MPKVPTATDAGLGQVKAAPLDTPYQNLRPTADMFGASRAKALGSAGANMSKAADALASIAEQRQKEADERHLMEIEQEIRKYNMDQILAAQQRKGKNAFGVAEEAEKGFEERFGGILDGRGMSRSARLRAEKYIGMSRLDLQSRLEAYESGQRDAYDLKLMDDRITGAIEDAATFYNDPEKIKLARSTIKTTHAMKAERSGMPVAEDLERDISRLHKEVIKRMVANGQGSAAKAYLQKAQEAGEIDGADVANIEKSVKTAAVDEEGQALMAQHYAPDKPLADVYRDIEQSGASIEAQDEAKKRARAQRAVEDSDRARAKKEAAAAAWSHILAGGNIGSFMRAEPEKFQIIAGDGALMSALNSAIVRVAKGNLYAPVSDGKTLDKLLALPEAELAALDPQTVQMQLTEQENAKLRSRINAAKKAQRAIGEEQEIFNIGKRVLADFAPQSLKFGSEKVTEDEYKRRQEAIHDMNAYIAEYMADYGKKPSRQEIEQEAVRLMLKVQVDLPNTGWLWLPRADEEAFSRYVFQADELTPAQRAAARVNYDDIPAHLRQQYENEVRERGIAYSTELIEQIAGAIAMGDRERLKRLLGED